MSWLLIVGDCSPGVVFVLQAAGQVSSGGCASGSRATPSAAGWLGECCWLGGAGLELCLCFRLTVEWFGFTAGGLTGSSRAILTGDAAAPVPPPAQCSAQPRPLAAPCFVPLCLLKRPCHNTTPPCSFDPANPGPPPDPERWLPKWQRSDAKKLRKKMKGKVGVALNDQRVVSIFSQTPRSCARR